MQAGVDMHSKVKGSDSYATRNERQEMSACKYSVSHRLGTSIILGLSAAELGVQNYLLCICDYSVLVQTLDCFSVQKFGIALPYLYAGLECYFVWHLQVHVNVPILLEKLSGNSRSKVWFLLQKQAASSFDSLITKRLNYHHIKCCFRLARSETGEDIGMNFSTFTSCSSYQEIPVQMLAREVEELEAFCPTQLSSPLALQSMLKNACKFVHEIRITPPIFATDERQASVISSLVAECILSPSGFPDDSLGCVQVKQETSTDLIPDEPFISTHEPVNTIQIDEMSVKFEESSSSVENIVKGEEEKETVSQGNEDNVFASKCTAQTHYFIQPICKLQTERFLMVVCPLCGMTYRSSKNRVKSLISHIHRRHPENKDILLKVVTEKYAALICHRKKKARGR